MTESFSICSWETAMELKLLEHLMLRTGETVTRSELHDKVWDMHFDPSSNVIDAHVARLRKKLQQAGASASITTRRGMGFVLSPLTPSQNTTYAVTNRDGTVMVA